MPDRLPDPPEHRSSPRSVIRTERLVLRPYDQDEAEAVLAGNRAGRAWAQGFPREDDKDAVRAFLRSTNAEPTFTVHQMVLRETGEVIGGIGFFGPPDETGTAEFGYGIAPEYEGRGLTTEAVRGLLARAFEDDRLRRLVADTTLDNIGSQRVMEKAGMTRVRADKGVVRYVIDRPSP